MTHLSIGALAARSGVKVPTIRYYEEAGLLPPPVRTAGGQRRYGPETLTRLRFIRHGRELGFGLEALRDLLALSDHPEQSCAAADSIARRQLEAVEARIAELTALRDELSRMVRDCGMGQVCDCRVLETIGDHSHCAHEQHGEPRRRS